MTEGPNGKKNANNCQINHKKIEDVNGEIQNIDERRRREDSSYEDIMADKSRYGEFMSTFHHWTGLEGNADRAEFLQNISKKQKNKKEK